MFLFLDRDYFADKGLRRALAGTRFIVSASDETRSRGCLRRLPGFACNCLLGKGTESRPGFASDAAECSVDGVWAQIAALAKKLTLIKSILYILTLFSTDYYILLRRSMHGIHET